MVLFRHSESAHTIMGSEGTEGVSDDDDPQKVCATPLTDKNSLKKTCDNDLQCNPKDLRSWNGSISQRWRKIRRCCASLRSPSAQNTPEPCRDTLLRGECNSQILVNIPQISNSLRIPNSKKKTSVQDVIRTQFNRMHVALRKRRALSVQEVFNSPTHDEPTFYVPSAVDADCDSGSVSLPIIDTRVIIPNERGRQRTKYKKDNTSFETNTNDHGYHSCEGSTLLDKLPYEPEPDYDDDRWCSTQYENLKQRRWSVVDGLMRYGTSTTPRPKIQPIELDSGPSSLQFANYRDEAKPNAVNQQHQSKYNTVQIKNKIPKAKLCKHHERARSHSPAKNTSSVSTAKNNSPSDKDNAANKVELKQKMEVKTNECKKKEKSQKWLEELEEENEEENEEEEESKFCTLPRGGGSTFTIRQVVFQKGPGLKALGFTIVGGRDSPKGSMGIYVKTIIPSGQAAENGHLREGDEILAVNGKPLHGVSHQEAIAVFKQIRVGQILLHIGRRVNRKKKERLSLAV